MHVATRFSIGIHVLALLGTELPAEPTSEFIAGSVGVNPVVIRNVLGMLRRAGLVSSRQGVAGAHLAKALEEMSLLDVYHAVEANDELFAIHQHPHPRCPVGAHIQETLEGVLSEAQRAMEARLAASTMADIVANLQAAAR